MRLDREPEDRGGTSRLILQVHDEVVLEYRPPVRLKSPPWCWSRDVGGV
ncbi:MAG: hypothetical protein IPH38_18535 [Candidatus Microthrix sp.]|nr:hypothetical protein [Candidatus Microthrix sp.]MBK7021532.1 hypothetical protein [Candidatus Microthrix sp.]